MKLVGLHGRAGAGKDTVADILCSRHDFIRYSFAGPLKDGLIAMFGLRRHELDWPHKERVIPELGVTPRRLMQTLGTEWGRKTIAEDIWVRLAEKSLQYLIRISPRIVITDVRFPNEAEWIRRKGGQVWHVVRPTPENVERLEARRHASEEPLPIVVGEDSVIDNSEGLEQLADEVKSALNGECLVQGIPLEGGTE